MFGSSVRRFRASLFRELGLLRVPWSEPCTGPSSSPVRALLLQSFLLSPPRRFRARLLRPVGFLLVPGMSHLPEHARALRRQLFLLSPLRRLRARLARPVGLLRLIRARLAQAVGLFRVPGLSHLVPGFGRSLCWSPSSPRVSAQPSSAHASMASSSS